MLPLPSRYFRAACLKFAVANNHGERRDRCGWLGVEGWEFREGTVYFLFEEGWWWRGGDEGEARRGESVEAGLKSIFDCIHGE